MIVEVWLKLGSEEDENLKILKTDEWTDRRTTYDRRSEKPNAGELKVCLFLFSKLTTIIYVRYMHVIFT